MRPFIEERTCQSEIKGVHHTLSLERTGNHPSLSSLEQGYYLHPNSARVYPHPHTIANPQAHNFADIYINEGSQEMVFRFT
jgi:hypothetical protein